MEDAERTATNIDRTPAGLNSDLIQKPSCRQLKAFRLRYEPLLLDVRIAKDVCLRLCCRHRFLPCT